MRPRRRDLATITLTLGILYATGWVAIHRLMRSLY